MLLKHYKTYCDALADEENKRSINTYSKYDFKKGQKVKNTGRSLESAATGCECVQGSRGKGRWTDGFPSSWQKAVPQVGVSM